MALKKDKVLENGIVLTYHRVVSVNSITNMQSMIEVGSYLNKEQREKEREWYETGGQERLNVYIGTTYYTKEYDKDLNVDTAYEYLKTLEDFADAEDIFEDPVVEEIPEETTPEEEVIEEPVREETEVVEEENK
jgi:hypothetical protein